MRGRAAGRAKGFIEVEGCGAGVMLIARDCIEQMLKKLPKISDTAAPKNSPLARGLNRLIRAFDPITLDAGRMSEDFSFCHRWRVECGGEIWASTNRKITHVGVHHFEGRWADASGPRIVVGGSAAAKAQGRSASGRRRACARAGRDRRSRRASCRSRKRATSRKPSPARLPSPSRASPSSTETFCVVFRWTRRRATLMSIAGLIMDSRARGSAVPG